jgi:glucose uptake protein GlcU
VVKKKLKWIGIIAIIVFAIFVIVLLFKDSPNREESGVLEYVETDYILIKGEYTYSLYVVDKVRQETGFYVSSCIPDETLPSCIKLVGGSGWGYPLYNGCGDDLKIKVKCRKM